MKSENNKDKDKFSKLFDKTINIDEIKKLEDAENKDKKEEVDVLEKELPEIDFEIYDKLNEDNFLKTDIEQDIIYKIGKDVASMSEGTFTLNELKRLNDVSRKTNTESVTSDTSFEEKSDDIEEKKEKKSEKTHNSRLSNVTTGVFIVFVIMILYLWHFIAFDADEIINNPYNKRSSILEKSILRGRIYSADNCLLAYSNVGEDNKNQRFYPYKEIFAHVVGRVDKGKSGLESKYDFDMLTTNENELAIIVDDFQECKPLGNSIYTTLNTNLQTIAYKELGDRKGAVVAIEPKTGKILAMASTPSYDPNTVSENWDALTDDENEEFALMNRASQGLYAPGSTFKIVTALEYLRENKNAYEDFKYDCNGELTFDDYTLHCYNNKSHGIQDLGTMFANSCNCGFADIGLGLNIDKFNKTCNKLLFNSELPYDYEYSKSSFSLSKDMGDETIANYVIGQGKALISPLHNALITAAIANNGVLMKPYMVNSIKDCSDKTVKKYEPIYYEQLMSKDEADILKSLMRKVVTDGTAKSLDSLNVKVAGKTGTAEYNSNNNSHGWFVCFAPYDNPKIVLSIIVEDGNTGAESAVPIANAILSEYFK